MGIISICRFQNKFSDMKPRKTLKGVIERVSFFFDYFFNYFKIII